ncbi:MAG: hypothetical protein AAF645_13765 [Myxococcota bacterium]
MRSIHVATLPFPSAQGTQGWLHASLSALAKHGDATLLCYERADGTLNVPFEVQRAGGAKVGLRSGPSFEKVFADLALGRRLRSLAKRYPDATIAAHNVEAAWLCRFVLGTRPWIYVAHTRMDTELPTYAHARLAPLLKPAGHVLDRVSATAPAIGAVSPALASHLGGLFLPVPWPIKSSSPRPSGPPTALYAGNLDGYQGIEALRAASAVGYRLIVATESSDSLEGIEVHRRLPMRTEEDRTRAHAMAHVALVPRRAEGGLPMKMLDALARGVPVATTHVGLAGLRPAGAVARRSLVEALRALKHEAPSADAGREWMAANMNAERFVWAFDALVTSCEH